MALAPSCHEVACEGINALAAMSQERESVNGYCDSTLKDEGEHVLGRGRSDEGSNIIISKVSPKKEVEHCW